MDKKNSIGMIIIGLALLFLGIVHWKTDIEGGLTFGGLGLLITVTGILFLFGMEVYPGQKKQDEDLKNILVELGGTLVKGYPSKLFSEFEYIVENSNMQFRYGLTKLMNHRRYQIYGDKMLWISMTANNRGYFFVKRRDPSQIYWHPETDFYFGIPIRSNDISFDTDYRTVSLSPGISKKILSNDKIRHALNTLLKMGFDNVCIRPKKIKANMLITGTLPRHGNADTTRNAVKIMKEITDILPLL